MKCKIKYMGESIAVLIPESALKKHDLSVGDVVDITISERMKGKVLLSISPMKRKSRSE